MTQQEVEQTLALHTQEIQDIRATLNQFGQKLDQVGQKLDQVGQKLDQVADQQEANTQQIARLTESLMQLGTIVATYVQGAK